MKNKIIVITTSVLLIIFSLFVSKQHEDKHRYHEHIEKNINVKKYDYKNINSKTENTLNITRKNIKSNLPIIELNVDMPVAGYHKDEFGFVTQPEGFSKANFKLYDEDNKLDIESKADIRYRGNSSIKFDKKGYLIKLKKENGKDNNVELLNMGKESEWVLHGPYLDKTLMRNYMWYNIAGEILEYSPNCRYVELFVNDKYEGLYLLVEKIKVSKYSRLNIDRTKKNDVTTSFLLELVQKNDARNEVLNNLTRQAKTMDKNTRFEILYPTKNKITEKQIEYINSYINKFEKTLYSYDYDSKRFGYDGYIDVNNFVDYLILSEVTMNTDNGNRSTYFYKDAKGKIKLSFWDSNNIFNNFFKPVEEDLFIMKDKLWFNMLLKDQNFTNKVIKRYHELRRGVLSDKYLNDYIDNTINYLNDAIKRNYSRWGNSFTEEKNLLVGEDRNIESYEEAINQYRNTMNKRLKWLDENINSLKQFSHESNIKNYNP